MNKPHLRRWLRSMGLGLLCACLGLSISLATSGTNPLGTGTSQIGTNATRPATVFVTDQDLGVVVVGTQFTRQILVKFGYKPHHFSLGATKPRNPIGISDSGTLYGYMATPDADTFEVRVSDGVDSSLVAPIGSMYTIRGVNYAAAPSLALQFVNAASLPRAVANEPYSFTLHANGGTPPYTFTLASDAELKTFPPGLSLDSANSVLYGKPYRPSPEGQPYAFTIKCTDALGTQVSQQFTMAVLSGTVSSDIVATAGSLKLNFGADGATDAFSLSMTLNKTDLAVAGIRQASDLSGVPVGIELGGAPIPPAYIPFLGGSSASTFDNTFNRRGKLHFPDPFRGWVASSKKNVRFQIDLNPKTGVLKMSGTNFDLIKALGANMSTFDKPVIPISVRIGLSAPAYGTTSNSNLATTTTTVNYDKTDLIQFSYRRSSKVGKANAGATLKVPPAGLFIITGVKGSEKKTSNVVDRLYLQFNGLMRGVGGKPVSIGTGDLVSVFLAKTCLGQFPATSLKESGGKLSFRNDDTSALLHNFAIDTKKGKVQFDTFGVLPRALFGQDILEGGVPLQIPVTITIAAPGSIQTTFDGQSSIAIYRKGGKIVGK